jgi:hypothetical protein
LRAAAPALSTSLAWCLFAGRREGARMDQPGIDLLRIVDGKIVEVWLFSSDPEQEDAFWGK